MGNMLVVKTDGTFDKVPVGPEDDVEVLQALVGGWVQVVGLPRESTETEPVALWLNEEGKLTGLERNNLATYLWARSYGLTDVIFGDVVLTSGDADTNDLSLSEAMLEDLIRELSVFA